MFSHVLKKNNQGVINLGLFLDPESLPTEQKLSFEVFIAADSLQKNVLLQKGFIFHLWEAIKDNSNSL